MKWLVIDLLHNTPSAVLIEDKNPFGKGPKKPIQLFLTSHGKNKIFQRAVWKSEFGRVFVVDLVSTTNEEEICQIEIRLIPRQVNVLVTASGKSIAWEKPQAVEVQAALVQQIPDDRSIADICEEWKAEFYSKTAVKPKVDPREKFEAQRQKDLAKKRKALAELDQKILQIDENPYRLVGEYIKANQTLKVPQEWEVYIDRKINLQGNIERCFQQAKLFQGKRMGSENRVRELKLEIAELEAKKFNMKTAANSAATSAKLKDFKGRKLILKNDSVAFLGKSAQDNLSLLRQARAWDYWLHLRDFPGAHVIIKRQKDQPMHDEDFREAALWLSHETFAKKSIVPGEKLAVLIAECRHVKPIKGDKLGRVNYHNERVLFVVSE